MREQTTNLNGDDFCAPRCFDSNKAISRITRQSGKHEMLCCGIKQCFFFKRKKFKENQPQEPQRTADSEHVIAQILQ